MRDTTVRDDFPKPVLETLAKRVGYRCSNPSCRRELAFCSHCRDVSTYTLVEKGEGLLGRDHYKCDRCERLG